MNQIYSMKQSSKSLQLVILPLHTKDIIDLKKKTEHRQAMGVCVCVMIEKNEKQRPAG